MRQNNNIKDKVKILPEINKHEPNQNEKNGNDGIPENLAAWTSRD